MANFEFTGLKSLLTDIQKLKSTLADATGDVKGLAQAFQSFNQGSSQLAVNQQLNQLRQQMTSVHETMVKTQMQTGGVSGFSQGLQNLVQSRKAVQDGNLYTANFGGPHAAGSQPPTTETVPSVGMGPPRGQALPFMSDAARSQAAIFSSISGGARNGGLTDVIEAQKFSATFAQNQGMRSKIVENLSGQDSLVAKDLVKAMQQNEKNVQNLTKTMGKLEEGIKKAEAGGDNARADSLRRRLGSASGSLLNAKDEAEDLLKYGGGMGGGGGGGGRLARARDSFEKNKDKLMTGGLALSALGAGYLGYREIDEQIQKRINNSPYAIMQARAQAEMAGVNREMMLGDPTNGRALLLGAGDIMFPGVAGRTNGLGLSGRQASETNARKTAAQELDAAKGELVTSLIKATFGLAGAVAGGAVTVLSGGTASLAGAGIAAGGVGMINSAIGGISNNAYAQSQGGIVGVLSKLPGLKGLQDSQSVAIEKSLFESEQEARVQSHIDQMREDSLNTRESQRFMAGFEQVRAADDAGRQAIGRLGGLARSGLEGLTVTSPDALALHGVSPAWLKKNVPAKGKQSILDDLGVTVAEFGGAQNTLTGSMLNNRAATDDETSNFLKLSRAGVGSAEQLSGNLMALGQVANTGNANTQLRDVLTDAVALGFSKSPMTQKFVQSVVELSTTLRTSSTETVSTALRAAASFGGVGDKADIRSMNGAKEGLAAYASLTGQTSGMGGVLRADYLMRNGITLATGGGILNGMNDLQVQAAMDQIKDRKITDGGTAALARSMGLKVDNEGVVTGGTKKVLNQLKGFRSTTTTPVESTLRALFTSEKEGYEALKARAKKGNKKAMSSLVSMIQGAIPGQETYDAASATASRLVGYEDPNPAATQKTLAALENEGEAARKGDVFYAQRIKTVNQLAAQARESTTGELPQSQVEQYFKSGENSELTFKDRTGVSRTARSAVDYLKQTKEFGGGAQLQDALAQKQAESALAEGKYVFATIDNIGPNARAVLDSVFNGIPDKRGKGTIP